jgi:hypothetical protein
MPLWAAGPLLALVIVFCSVTPAFAWGNSGDSFGSHDWILLNALRLSASRGVSWAETSTALRATDDPDTTLMDFYYHSYDVWGTTKKFADAPTVITDRYSDVVRLLKAGDRAGASKYLGRMAHYFGDINEPLHTEESGGETKGVHKGFETSANRAMTSSYANLSWIHDDGDSYVSDPYKRAVSAATHAHGLYFTLMRGYLAGGYSSSVRRVTGLNVDRAVNDLADIISSASSDAGLTTITAPALPAAGLTKPAVVGKVARSKTFSLKGVLKARHPAGEWAVKLYCYRYEGGFWKLRKTVAAKVADDGEDSSSYRVSTTLPMSGKWRVRAVHSDADHRWSNSVYKSITVP